MLNKVTVIRSNHFSNVMEKLHDSSFIFELTGSRFIDNKIEGDWDFFTESYHDVDCFLRSLGFREPKSTAERYQGLNGVSNVLRATFSTGEQIDVQLVYDFELKRRVNNFLKSWAGFKFSNWPSLTKEQKKQVWGQLLTTMV